MIVFLLLAVALADPALSFSQGWPDAEH